ncbi:hypothetical protein ENHYD8BJ_80104 [Enhydrobacter sp. 8BJ]|nr:hypothetical protein ENHYD8BJ_80104 [Enhydrobacter sp. 8BJ]
MLSKTVGSIGLIINSLIVKVFHSLRRRDGKLILSLTATVSE